MKKSLIIMLSIILPGFVLEGSSYLIMDEPGPKSYFSCLENLKRLICKPTPDEEQSPRVSPRDPRTEPLLYGASVAIADTEVKTSPRCIIL